MLAQQKAQYEDLLQRQQSTFQSFISTVMDSNNKRMNSLIREVQEIKDSLQYSQAEIEDSKTKQQDQNQSIKDVESKLDRVGVELSTIVNKADYLENQSRRNNILIDGVPDNKQENWTQCEQKVREILKDKLKLGPLKIEIERSHRNGKFQEDGRPRPIVAKLLRYKDKEVIMQKAKFLKGSNIYNNEDFSEAVRQKRKDLLPEMRAARERGNVAYLRFDRLVVHPPRDAPRGSS
ncbi:Hypp6412 [Branchiostoma lanceolatum]|uniref:Hypp6412 protein n=1 Tax=Branchiostoma lanceolatum TaxID=7740 RepID=A0A8J9YU36_BRALA|nr:Hypp6412 [Branchiostoma lanceolatum]